MQVPIHSSKCPPVHGALSPAHTERQFGALLQLKAPFRLPESIYSFLCSRLVTDDRLCSGRSRENYPPFALALYSPLCFFPKRALLYIYIFFFSLIQIFGNWLSLAGIKISRWLATYRGSKLTFNISFLRSVGCSLIFTIGELTGIVYHRIHLLILFYTMHITGNFHYVNRNSIFNWCIDLL